MRLVFAGTPPFAARALAALAEAGHEIALVLTQPDRPAGRGLKVIDSAVGQWAAAHGLPVAKPPNLKSEDAIAEVRAAGAEVVVVAAYGLLLPPALLGIPPAGCLNIHASLLPRWRGAAPIQRAILAGDAETGVCIMRMEAGLDTGPVLLERRVPIDPRETTATLTERLAALGASAVVEALERLPALVPRPQEGLATYAAKVTKAEARIEWTRPAEDIDRQVRAFDPTPGAETVWSGQALKIWRARPAPGSGRPGQLLRFRNSEMVVACGHGALEILTVQWAGGRRMEAPEFARGALFAEGESLG